MSVLAVALAALVASGAATSPGDESHSRIPVFARRYRTSCSTCHTAAPKLNAFGEAFRLNGYRFPENDRLVTREAPVPLGAEEWKDEWPRAIWPGEVPGGAPIAVRLVNDIEVTRDETAVSTVNLRFPQDVSLLAAGSLGGGIAAYVEAEWARDQGLEVVQAKVELQDVFPWLPRRAFNLWAGLQNLYLQVFADHQIDRAARQTFRWQSFQPASLTVTNPTTGDTLVSVGDFQLRRTQPAVEANGLLGGRLYYGLGLAQGSLEGVDANSRKDVYYKLRLKLGGLGLDGRYPEDVGPIVGRGGQLLDRTIIVEQFGYFGAQPVAGGVDDEHRTFGVSARGVIGPLDVGAGFVTGRHERPWGGDATGFLEYRSWYARAEYLLFPWLIASVKVEDFATEVDPSLRAAGYVRGSGDQGRVLPGVIALARQNVRAVLEGDLALRDGASEQSGRRLPRAVWLRLDVAF